MNAITVLHVVSRNLDVARHAERSITALLVGRTVEVISNFNDQQYGRSKPTLKGKRFTVHNAFVDDGHVTVWLEGCHCGARLWEDVVLVDQSGSGK
jgi:hypothetical protein